MDKQLQNFMLEKYFSNKIGLCVMDIENNILYQNNKCKKVCGDRIDVHCEIACKNYCTSTNGLPNITEGVRNVRIKEYSGKIYDVAIINNGNQILTILYPLSEKIERQLEFLKSFHLSMREVEVMSQLLKGLSNTEISQKLFISQKTLKTHLNNIYKKLPIEVVQEIKSRII